MFKENDTNWKQEEKENEQFDIDNESKHWWDKVRLSQKYPI